MKIFIAIFLAMVLVLTMSFRRCNTEKWRVKAFCFRMVKQPAFRDFYGKKIVIFLLLFHFVYQTVFTFQIGIPLSMILTCLMLRKRTEERILQLFGSNVKAIAVLFIITVATAFTPQMYSVAFTTGTILIASFFYTQKKVLNNKGTEDASDDMQHIADSYFSTFYR